MSEAIVTIRVARDASTQQAVLGNWLSTQLDGRSPQKDAVAVIAEGAFSALAAPDGVIVNRIAAGCVCCIGQIALRVTLTRLLRAHRPARLLLLLTSGEHIDRVRKMLGDGQFAALLRLSDSVHDAGSR
jgi:hypothetical protein